MASFLAVDHTARLMHTALRGMLLSATLATSLIHAAELDLKISLPNSAYAGTETKVFVTGEFDGKQPWRATWFLSFENTIIARGSTELTPGKRTTAQFSFKPPAVLKTITMQLDVSVSGKHTSSDIRIFPDTWPKDLAAAHATASFGVFDSGTFVEHLEKLGVRTEACSTALGLNTFKGDILLISPTESVAGFDFGTRLDARVKAGLTVIVFVPDRLQLSGLTEPVSVQPAHAAIKAAKADIFSVKNSFNGLISDRTLRVGKDTALWVLAETDDAARTPVIVEREHGRGRWIIVAFDPVERAAEEPAALNLFWNLLDYSTARKGTTKE